MRDESSHSVRLQRATAADAATLEALAIAFKADDPAPRAAEEIVALRVLLEAEHYGHAYLIEVQGRMVGYAVLCWGYSIEYRGRDAFLDEFYIEEVWRGRGIGTRVLEMLVDAAGAEGIKTLHLEVLQDEIRAANLYRRAGWADRGSLLMSKRIA